MIKILRYLGATAPFLEALPMHEITIGFVAISCTANGDHQVNHLPVGLIKRLMAARQEPLTAEEIANPTIAVSNTIEMALSACPWLETMARS